MAFDVKSSKQSIVSFISSYVVEMYYLDNSTKKFPLDISLFILAEDKQEGKTGIESPSM